jgi:hypothetical protein
MEHVREHEALQGQSIVREGAAASAADYGGLRRVALAAGNDPVGCRKYRPAKLIPIVDGHLEPLCDRSSGTGRGPRWSTILTDSRG